MNRPLIGIRVLEIADLSAAYCGRLLADHGAEVVKIEAPRGTASPIESRLFDHYSSNKRLLTLDLGVQRDRHSFDRLVRKADIVIDADPSFGLDPSRLLETNDRLIVGVVRPYPAASRHVDDLASDLICQAAGGMIFANGESTTPPLQGAGLQAYHVASIETAIRILAAKMTLPSNGKGAVIHVSTVEAVAAYLERATTRYREHGIVAQRQGSLHETRHFRIGRCSDGYILLSSLGDWTSLVEWMRADDKADDLIADVWHDVDYRSAHAEHLFEVLDRWAASYSVAELFEGAQLRRLPFAAVGTTGSLAFQPQLISRGFFRGVVESPPSPMAPGIEPREESFAVSDNVSATLPVEEPSGPLKGLRVIDFTWVVAGPLTTRRLASLGAEVIKIERVPKSYESRSREGLDRTLNLGKQSIAINMDDERGRALARSLVSSADVVIDNFSPRVLTNWGMDDTSLQRLRAGLVIVHLSGFGHTGPWRDYVSYAPTLQALAGCGWLMRRRDTAHPVGWGFSFADFASGHMATLTTLMAIWKQRQSGEGQLVDFSQFECLVNLLGPHDQASAEPEDGIGLATEIPGGAIDNDSQEVPSAPHGVYRCADRSSPPRERWCAIAVFDESEWKSLCTVTDHPEWIQDRRFRTLHSRIVHRKELDELLAHWTRRHPAEDVVSLLQSRKIRAAIVADARDLCERGLDQTVEASLSPAPRVGEHSESILSRILGLAQPTIADLRRDGIIG